MSMVIRQELVNIILNRAYASTDDDNNLDMRYRIRQKIICDDKLLTKDEKIEALRKLNKYHDRNKVNFRKGKTRNCENCQQTCLAMSYCEKCVRDYLKTKFSNWSSGNTEIDS